MTGSEIRTANPTAPPGGACATAPAPVGLSAAEVAAQRDRHGMNVLPQRPPISLSRRVATQLRDPMILVLLLAAALTAATADWTDMAVILFVVVANTAVGVSQEVRADHAIAALSALTAPTARVIRGGAQTEIPATEVVVGDLLVLSEGDIVAADASLTRAVSLLVDESAVTGESVPVDKDPGGDRRLTAGTVVVRGRGRAEVTAVGAASATGRIAHDLSQGGGLTPLQRRLIGIGRLLAGVTIGLCAIVLTIGLLRGQPVELMVVTAISLAVAAVPESLPAVVTLALALGAHRMATRHALVRRLPAVETLGSVTVLATDKTGTLTEGRMTVREIWAPGGEVRITGSGAGGEAYSAAREPDPVTPELTELLAAVALCNDAHLSPPAGGGDTWVALGDPTEIALLNAVRELGFDPDTWRRELPRVGEIPFDSERKRMSTVHRLAGGRFRVICKGAPEAVLDSGIAAADPALAGRAREHADRLAHGGFRVLAVASADHDTRPAVTDAERGLRLLGLVAIVDPARPAAAGTIAACRTAGIRPVLITGDHPGTARAIAAETGILGAADRIVDCRAHAEHELPAATVYARATPAQKLEIIRALRADGQVVAMNGDGVNDAPALRRADIGVAMGKRGTEVARQAADLVLADDDLGTVVAAVEEGRRIYANIRRFLVYGLSGGATEIAIMLAGPAFVPALPLLPAQILWINLLTHGLPGVALGGEPAGPRVMRRGPRPPTESILAAGLWQRVLRMAATLTVLTLGIAIWAEHTGRPWQSMTFFALGAAQLGVALGSRTRLWTRANPLLPLAVAAAMGLQFAALYVPFLRGLLGTEALGFADLLIVAAPFAVGFAAIRLDRMLFRGRRH